MHPLLEEFLLVLAHSRRTQWALLLGVIGFTVTLLAGAYFSSQLVFSGLLAPMSEPLQHIFLLRCEIAAWGVLVSCLVLATKSYVKDRKRLLG